VHGRQDLRRRHVRLSLWTNRLWRYLHRSSDRLQELRQLRRALPQWDKLCQWQLCTEVL
jgi:hypothetical protein